MTTTSWSHSSKIALAACLLLVAAAVPVGAVTVGDQSVPATAEAGSDVEVTVTLTELYQSPQIEEWTLTGSTELRNATWRVAFFDQTGSQIAQRTFGGQSLSNVTVSAARDHSRVEITLTGRVPEPSSYTYDPQQSFTAVTLEQVPPGGGGDVLVNEETAHFTSESQSAREAIDTASTAVSDAGEPSEAQESLDRAIQAYDEENFELATELANEAQNQAEAAQNTRDRNRLLLIGGGVVLALAVVGGGVWYYMQQRSGPDRLG